MEMFEPEGFRISRCRLYQATSYRSGLSIKSLKTAPRQAAHNGPPGLHICLTMI